MALCARIAVGTIQPDADATILVWALLASLVRTGRRVQSFRSQANFSKRDSTRTITGAAERHLDGWLMNAETCRTLFEHGTRACDLAVLSGPADFFVPPRATKSSLGLLCEWLDMPRLAVVDARRVHPCQLPDRPQGVAGILLDYVESDAQRHHLATLFESLWSIPVVGSLGHMQSLRRAIDDLPPGRQPTLELCRSLSDAFVRHSSLAAILKLVGRGALPCRTECASPPQPWRGMQIAVAYDDAFGDYFPDLLERIEWEGARIREFSPLADERLPGEPDLVYIGGGHPELFADVLAANQCMALAIRSHVCRGGRLYAEAGGMAYLCQQLELCTAGPKPMLGIFPATARFSPLGLRPRPAETVLHADTPGGTCQKLRGYLNADWELSLTAPLEPCSQGSTGAWEMIRWRKP